MCPAATTTDAGLKSEEGGPARWIPRADRGKSGWTSAGPRGTADRASVEITLLESVDRGGGPLEAEGAPAADWRAVACQASPRRRIRRQSTGRQMSICDHAHRRGNLPVPCAGRSTMPAPSRRERYQRPTTTQSSKSQHRSAAVLHRQLATTAAVPSPDDCLGGYGRDVHRLKTRSEWRPVRGLPGDPRWRRALPLLPQRLGGGAGHPDHRERASGRRPPREFERTGQVSCRNVEALS